MSNSPVTMNHAIRPKLSTATKQDSPNSIMMYLSSTIMQRVAFRFFPVLCLFSILACVSVNQPTMVEPPQQPQGITYTASRILPPSRYRQEALCNSTGKKSGIKYDRAWAILCQGDFVFAMDMVLAQTSLATTTSNIARVVQIGAHVGFEENDPVANGILSYVKMLSMPERHRFQWTFVEPSTTNFRSLQKNLDEHAHLGTDFQAIQAGVVADSTIQDTDMIFYSIRDTIDPVTGFDSLSNHTFPYWVTQISSFNLGNIEANRKEWTKRGLKMEEYVIQSNVTTKRYSDLMKDILQGDDPSKSLVMVLIDTEGFDCPIVNGIAADSLYLPQFLVFEDKQCSETDKQSAWKHLKSMGYITFHVAENTVAYRQQDRQPYPKSTTATA
jgi:hypothetical protein